jgi:glycosyltransferase involved in cell wall biosynthesis
MNNRIIAISNHGSFLGGGEYSFLELLVGSQKAWDTLAVVPHEGEVTTYCADHDIRHCVIELPQLRPANLRRSLRCLFALVKKIRAENPKFIYANGSRAALYGALAARLCKLPCVWHCRMADKDPFIDGLLQILCSHIIANSHATANRFGSKAKHKATVVYNGIDIQWITGGNGPNDFGLKAHWKVILVVARLSRWKRHDVALRVFEQLAGEDPQVHLVCVGGEDVEDPQWLQHLQSMSARSQFQDRIHWTGKVADVRPWYQKADVLLLPSENEPFGRVLVEAMANGVPVVATNGGGVPELITDRQEGFLVNPDDIEAMQRRLKGILYNTALREQLAEGARKRALAFSLKKHVETMETLWSRIG